MTRARPVGDRASASRSSHLDHSTREQIRARLARPVTLSAVLKATPTAHDASKRRISVVETRLSVLDAVPTHVAHALERLYASRNRLSSLCGIERFPNLRLLSAGDNLFRDVSDLDALSRCSNLEVVSLERTPVSKLPFYREHVIARCSETLRSLDGQPVDDAARRRAASAVRRDVAHLENLMRAAATTDKLRRAYRLSLVHEELRQVVFAARGPVAPASLPARHETAGGVDVRTWTRLCAPERAMSRAEVAECARRLRARVAAEAPEIRRAVRARGGEPLADDQLWESAYAARAQREQSDSAALAAYLEDREAAASEAAAASLDPFAAALRWGFEAAAAREAEMRADREAALTDMIDAEVAAAHSEYAGAGPDRHAARAWEFGDDVATVSGRAEETTSTREDWREDWREDDDARSTEDDVSAMDRWVASEREHISRSRVRRSERDRTLSKKEKAPAARVDVDAPTGKKKVPWGHGPGSKAEEARAREAAERRTGESGRTESRFGRVLSRTRSASPSRDRGETRAPRTPAHSPPRSPRVRASEPHPPRQSSSRQSSSRQSSSRRSSVSEGDAAFGPVDPAAFARGGVYDTLGAEVDALRAALESQTRGEAELLAANAALLQRCEEAEASAEASRADVAAAAARHAEALRDARADAEAAESHARELAAALDETAASADAADARDAASRLARETAERWSAEAQALVLAERAECASLREALASKLRDEERAADADALASRGAGKRALRVWASRTKRNKRARVLRAVHTRRCAAWRFNAWRARVRAQTQLRTLYKRRAAAAAVAALRAWRLARLVSEVAAYLVRRRALRRWARETARRAKVRAAFAEAGAAAANDAAEPGEAFEAAERESPESFSQKEKEKEKETRRLVEAGLADSAREGAADVLLAWRERASSAAMSPRKRRAALDEYADAVLSAARPAAERGARRARAAAALSAWHLAVTRAQQTRLETLVQTCDALGGAAAAAAEEARGVEAANQELRGELERARLAANAESWTRQKETTQQKETAVKETAVDQLAVVESNASKARADLTAELERERAARRGAEDEAKLLRVRVGGESGETRRAEAVAAAAAGEAAAWRSAAVTNEAALRRALESFLRWGAEMETEREAFGRDVGLSTGKKASLPRRRAKLSDRFRSFAFDAKDPDDAETTNDEPNALRDVRGSPADAGTNADASLGSSGTPHSSSSSVKTPASGASSFGSLDRALRVFGLAGSGAGNESGSADRKSRLRLAEEKRLARLPKPARASFAVLKTHARLAAALRRCGEAETSRRAEAEGAHAGAARAAEEARARVAADTSAATEAAAFAVEAEAAATILQSAVRGHLTRKRWRKSSVLKMAEAFEAARPAPAPVASTPRTDEARGDDATPGSVASSSGTRDAEGENRGKKAFLLFKRPDSDAESRYDESTQTLPEAEHRATQTPPRRPKPAAASPPSSGSRTTRNPFSSAKRVLREGRVVVTPTPKKSETKYPVKAPWRPPSNNIFDSPLSPPPSPKRP